MFLYHYLYQFNYQSLTLKRPVGWECQTTINYNLNYANGKNFSITT